MSSSPSPRPRFNRSLTIAMVLVGVGCLLGLMGLKTAISGGFGSGHQAMSGQSSGAAEAADSPSPAERIQAGRTPLSSLHQLLRKAPPGADSGTIEVPPPVIPDPMSPAEVQLFPRQTASGSFFADVPSDYWVTPMLMDLADRKLVKGFPDGTFRPGQPMTRAEFATQLVNVFDLPANDTAPPYRDVAADNWAYQNIQHAVAMGFLSGYPDNIFLPDQPVTRLEVMISLAKGLNLTSSSGSHAVLKRYHDRQRIPTWGHRGVVAATEAGLVINYPDQHSLRPMDLASRAEVIAMLHRALVYMGNVEDIPSPYTVIPQQMPH
jgi:hypothetical protein